MSAAFEEFRAIGRLELGEVRRSRWLPFCGVVYGLLGVCFVIAGTRESSVIGFTGTGRVLFSLVHALLLVLPLLALTATAQVVNRARDDGALEFFFTLPVRRSTYFAAAAAVRVFALGAPLLAMLLVLGLLGRVAFGQAVPWAFVLQSAALCFGLLVAFTGLGLLISTAVRNTTRATVMALLAWAAAVALLDVALAGAMLEYHLNPRAVFLLASLNPVQAVRMALLSGASTELSTLGPVGFYLSTRVGASGLLALGLGWPLALGALTFALGLHRFRRTDIV